MKRCELNYEIKLCFFICEMTIYIFFWYIAILQSYVSALRRTTPMQPPEEGQATKTAQMINFINLLKKDVGAVGYVDKRRAELTRVDEIQPWIANIYKILKSDEEQTSREYSQRLADSVRVHVLNNPEVLDEFENNQRKIKRKKDIRRPSYESSASSDSISISSVEETGRTRNLERRYDLEYIPDQDANSEELIIEKKDTEFGQLVPANPEQEDVTFKPEEENGPHFEPDLDFSTNQNENPKSIFAETLQLIKSTEVEAATKNTPKTDYDKDQIIVEGKYVQEEQENRNGNHKKKSKSVKPKLDEGDYDRGTYQKHSLEELSSKREETSTKKDLNYQLEEIKETESSDYEKRDEEKESGMQKRFKEEHRIKSEEEANNQSNYGAQDETIDQQTDVYGKNKQNHSKERIARTNERGLNGNNNEYKYEGNDNGYNWVKEQDNNKEKEESWKKTDKGRDDNDDDWTKDYDHKKYDDRNQKENEQNEDVDRNVKRRDKTKNYNLDKRYKYKGHDNNDGPNDRDRYITDNKKRNDDWNKKDSNKNKNNDWYSKKDNWKTKNDDTNEKGNWINKKDNQRNKNDWQTEKDNWATKRDDWDKKNDNNQKKIDWDTKNYDSDTEKYDWTTKRDDWGKKYDGNTKRENLIEKKKDWVPKKDAWKENKGWNTKKGDWTTKAADRQTEKDDWNTKKYDKDNYNDQGDDVDQPNYWDRNDKTKRKDNRNDGNDWKNDNKAHRKKESWDKKNDWNFQYSLDTKKTKDKNQNNKWDTVGVNGTKAKEWGQYDTTKKSLKQGSLGMSKSIEKDINIDVYDSIKHKKPSPWDNYVPIKPSKKKKRDSFERPRNNQPPFAAFGRTPIPFAGKKRIYAD